MAMRVEGALFPRIERVELGVYTVPTSTPESDGTFAWDRTTLVLVRLKAEGLEGLGYTYAHSSCADLIEKSFKPLLEGKNLVDVEARWAQMRHQVRNVGRPGIASEAIAAVDVALWDLKARALDLPLFHLIGAVRDSIPAYGSGGFTSYSLSELQTQLRSWSESGLRRVKMKVGRDPAQDLVRVRAARDAVGPDTELFVDANGAYTTKQALLFAEKFAELGVTWFEEPVSSDNLEGLHLLKERAPAGIDIAAGEYGYDLFYFRRMLEAEAVDVLQVDATRAQGVSGFLKAAVLCEAWDLPLSAHTAPSLHAHLGCACQKMIHVEYFYDHARIEEMFFEGVPQFNRQGCLVPDPKQAGLGLVIKENEVRRYAA